MYNGLLLTFADESNLFTVQRYKVEDRGIVFLQNVRNRKPRAGTISDKNWVVIRKAVQNSRLAHL
jgi:hypothetical protein